MRLLGISTITLISTTLVLTACPSGDDAADEVGTESTGDTTGADTSTTGDTSTSSDTSTTAGDTSTTAGDTTTGDTTDTTTGGLNDACMGMVAPAGTLVVGQPVSHWGGLFDLDGNDFDYCELGGKPFLLILSAGWCGPCHDLSAAFAGQASSWDAAMIGQVNAGMEAGTLAVVDIIIDNYNDFDATSLADLQMWESMHPNEFVHLVGDPTPGVNGEEPLWQYLGPSHMGGVPGGILVDADFNLEVIDLQTAISTAASKYGG